MKLAKFFSMLLCALLATTVAFPMKRQNSSMPPTKRQKIEEEPQPQPPVSLSCATTNTTNAVAAKLIKLESSDKKCVDISVAAAHVSPNIKNILEDLPDEQNDLVPLPMVSHQVLQKIVPLLEQEAQLQAQNHGESIIINTLLNGIVADNDWADNQLCCDATLAANWLGCQHILKVLTVIFIRTVSTDFYVQAFIAEHSNNHYAITITAEQLGAALDSVIDETIKNDVLKNFGRCAISLVEYSRRKNHDLCLVKKWAQNFIDPKLCSVINTVIKLPDCICYVMLLGKDSQQAFITEIELFGKLDNVIFIIEKDMALAHQMTVAGAPNVLFLQSIDNAFFVCIPSKFFSDGNFERLSEITALGLNPDQLKPCGFGYDTWLNYSREQRQKNVIDSLSNLLDENSAIKKRVFIAGHGNGGNEVIARMVSLKISEFRALLNRLCVWGGRDCSVEGLILRSCFSGGYNSVRFFTDNGSQPKLLPFTVGILSSADMPETSFLNSSSKLLKTFAASANSDINTIFRDAFGQEQLFAGSFPMVREANKQTFEPAALGERLITIDDRAKNVPIEYGKFSIENRSSSSYGGFIVKGMYPHLKDLFLPYKFAFDSLSQMVATFLSHIPGSSYRVISQVTIKDGNDVIKPLDKSFNIELEYDPQMRKVVFVNQMNDVQHVILDFNYSCVLRYDYKDFASLMNVYRLWYEAQPLPGVVPGYDRKKALEQFNKIFWGTRIPPKATLCTDMFEAFADGNCTKLQEAFARCKNDGNTAALELFLLYAVSHGLPLPPDIESDDIDGMKIGRCSCVESLAIDKTVLELFAQNGFDLKKRYFASKKSLFQLAVLAGNRCAVEFLLNHNYAMVDEKDIHEEDAIDYAIAASNSDLFKLLSHHGLSFELFEKVIDLQDWNNNAQPLLEKLLDEHHVTQNFLKSDNGFDVLCHAIRCKNVEAIKWLLKQGVPFVRSDGFTIFHFIGKSEDFDMSNEIEAVINTMLSSEQGKKLLNKLDGQGRTALDYAVKSVRFNYVELLSKHGAEVTEYINDCLKLCEDKILERLLEALLSNDKNDPLLQKLLQNRLKADVGFKILCSAVDRGNVRVIEWLLKQNVSVVRSDGFTIFHYVVQSFSPNIPECITALLLSPQGKAHVNDTCVIEGNALSAFELTILRNKTYISYIFLDHPEVQFQQRAMAMSIKDSEFYLLEKLLLRREARKYINAEDPNGETLLEISIQKGDPVFVKLLLDHGAKFSARKFKGLTPLQIFEKCFSGTDEARAKIKELLQRKGTSLL